MTAAILVWLAVGLGGAVLVLAGVATVNIAWFKVRSAWKAIRGETERRK